MSLIGMKLGEFKAKAYHNAKFINITHEDLAEKWSAIFFYPANFTLV